MTIVTTNGNGNGNGNNKKNLQAAKNGKNDRFFTQITDIENELHHYRKELKGKTVYVNCDGSVESNFRKHLMMAFDVYGLKRLIITTFKVDGSRASKYDITDGLDGDYRKLIKVTKPVKLKGDGDFRSDECIELLKQADVVIGNPPFSLFREYVAQIIAHKKKMIIVGNVNAVGFKEIFPLIQANKLWLGPSLSGRNPEFQVPDDYVITTKASRVDEKGNKFVKVTGVRWFTNLTHTKRTKEKLIMYKTYSKAEYPKYDNYDAINVDKVKGIPLDYAGEMGVPVTFIDKFNPKQFEIITNVDRPFLNGKVIYKRIIIRNKNPKV